MLRTFGAAWHRWVARLPLPLARFYLILLGLLVKRLPDGVNKQRIVNSVRHATWQPTLTLPAQSVAVGDGVRVRLTPHLQEFDFDALFFRTLPYEPEVFRFIGQRVAQYDAIVEIGANVGVFTVFLGRLAAQARPAIPVFAFEPSRTAYQRLLENVSANQLLATITPFNVAIADADGFMSFYEPEGHLTNGSLSADFAGIFSEQVQQQTIVGLSAARLSDLLATYPRVLLKIDVEGAEPLVLAALEPFITQQQPDIVLEVLPTTEADLNALPFLTAQYQLAHITPTGAQATPTFVAATYRDYWLTPRSAP